MARPKVDAPREVTLSVKVSELEAAAIDRARGRRPVSRWLHAVIAEALVDPQAPPVRQRVQAIPGGRDALAEAEARRDCPHPPARVHRGMCGNCGTGGLTAPKGEQQ